MSEHHRTILVLLRPQTSGQIIANHRLVLGRYVFFFFLSWRSRLECWALALTTSDHFTLFCITHTAAILEGECIPVREPSWQQRKGNTLRAEGDRNERQRRRRRQRMGGGKEKKARKKKKQGTLSCVIIVIKRWCGWCVEEEEGGSGGHQREVTRSKTPPLSLLRDTSPKKKRDGGKKALTKTASSLYISRRGGRERELRKDPSVRVISAGMGVIQGLTHA